MSDKSLARRTSCKIYFENVDISADIEKYLISLQFTDNEEDGTDDLQITLQDREGIWTESWLNEMIRAASKGYLLSSGKSESSESTEKKEETTSSYSVITETNGAIVRSRPGDQYYQYGVLPYGSSVEVISVDDNGWANIIYDGKNAYVRGVEIGSTTTTTYSSSGKKSETKKEVIPRNEKGLRIQANIARQNWKGDGKDLILECGEFELDNVSASGPPAQVKIKATSLPYSSSVRQNAKSKSWENYYLKGIAEEISNGNGMGCMFLSAHNPYYRRTEQNKVSDIAFLQKLCHNAGCSLKVTNNIIVVFDQATYEKKPSVKTIRKDSAGGDTKYTVATKSNEVYGSVRVSYTLSDGTVIEGVAEAENAKEDATRLEVHEKVSSIAEAQDLAKQYLRLKNKFGFSATFSFPGDPTLNAGSTVNLIGWGAWDGKYIISKAVHSVGSSGYTTQITLRAPIG